MPASPNITNYTIGKGIVSFKKDGEADFVDCGNCTSFEFTPTIETLDHFSSRQGVKTKDRTVVISKSGTLKMLLEEWTTRNLSIAALGDVDVDSEGRDVIDIFSASAVSGQVKFVGTNDVGPKWTWIFNKVDFVPGASLNPISDEWGVLELDGNVAADADNSFGTMTKTAEEEGASSSA